MSCLSKSVNVQCLVLNTKISSSTKTNVTIGQKLDAVCMHYEKEADSFTWKDIPIKTNKFGVCEQECFVKCKERTGKNRKLRKF